MSTDSTGAIERRPAVPASLRTASQERLVLMCASALFAGLTQRDLNEIASCARARSFARDELLFEQGQSSNSLIVLQSGSVKLTQISPSGSEVLMWMNGRGEPLTLNSGPNPCPHTCSARAMEQCHTLVWEYTRLQAILSQYPQIRDNISAILSTRLGELESRFHEVSTERVAKRLALALLRLMKSVGKPNDGGTEISLTREELAQMTGTTLFTISRILSRWAEQGFVQPRREAVIVSNRQKLEQASEEDL